VTGRKECAAYLRSLQPDSETPIAPSNEAEPSRAPYSHMHPSDAEPRSRCNDGSHAEQDAATGDSAHRNGTSHSPGAHPTHEVGSSASETAVRGEVGSYATDLRAQAARHADSVAWINAHAEQLGYDPPTDDGASEGPSATVKWVRNAIQRSWGAWLAGDSVPGAWQMCRDLASSPAEEAFLDELRGSKQNGDTGSHHMRSGIDARMADASGVASATASTGGGAR
jgi:hypothetical protein